MCTRGEGGFEKTEFYPYVLFGCSLTILYLTVVLNFAIDGRLDQFFMILVKGLERILSAPIDFVVIAVLSRCSSSRSNKVPLPGG